MTNETIEYQITVYPAPALKQFSAIIDAAETFYAQIGGQAGDFVLDTCTSFPSVAEDRRWRLCRIITGICAPCIIISEVLE